jgi:hypothetical protein
MARAALFSIVIECSCAGADTPRVVPDRGGQAGGEAVRIEGEGFVGHGPPVVYFGVRAAKAVVVEGDRLLTVVAPQVDEAGTVDVRASFLDGTVVEVPAAYTFEAREGVLLRPEIVPPP